MESTNVRKIKEAIDDQTYHGRRQVWVNNHERIVDAKTVKGQLKARLLNGWHWVNVDTVHID
jgi:hypothetical protein